MVPLAGPGQADSSVAQPHLLNRWWLRLQSLFVPSVSLRTLLLARTLPASEDVVLQLYTWERERLLTLAKGMGGAAVTVLAALIADATQGSLDNSNLTAVYLAGALVALLLVWSAFILSGLRRLAEQYSLALAVVS
jgi:hypothetical protein